MGNVVIGGVADAIKRSFPHEAVAMRYGGDEFVVLHMPCLLSAHHPRSPTQHDIFLPEYLWPSHIQDLPR